MAPQSSVRQPSDLDARFAWFAYLAWAACLIAGSWYPFDFHIAEVGFSLPLEDSIWRGSKSDLIVNFVPAIPCGLLISILTIRHGWLLGVSLWCSTFAASYIAEYGQLFLPDRNASWRDVLTQSIGVTTGIAVGLATGEWLLKRIGALRDSRLSGSGPLRAGLDLYVVGYTFWILMPFIPVIDPVSLKHKWAAAIPSSGTVLQDPMFWRNAWAAFATAVPVGWWVAFPRSATSRISTPLMAAAAALGLTLVEFSQIFIETRVAGLDDALFSAIGGALGVFTLLPLKSRLSKSDFSEQDDSTPVAPSGVHAIERQAGIAEQVRYWIILWVVFGVSTVVHCTFISFSRDRLVSGHEIRKSAKEFLSLKSLFPLGGNDWLLLSNLVASGVLVGFLVVTTRLLQFSDQNARLNTIPKTVARRYLTTLGIATLLYAFVVQFWKSLHEGGGGTACSVVCSVLAALIADHYVLGSIGPATQQRSE